MTMATKTLPIVSPSGNGKSHAHTTEMYTDTVWVTPELADQLLLAHESNRTWNETDSQAIARDILSGNFKLTHQSIAITSDGHVIDGQHRLHGVRIAKKAVPMRITYNCPKDIADVIDIGRKRKLSDTLRAFDGYSDSHRAQSIINLIGDAARIYPRKLQGGQPVPSQPERRALAIRYINAYHIVTSLLAEKRTKNPVHAALVFAYEFAPDKIVEFATAYNKGANLNDDSPILAVKNTQDRFGKTGLLNRAAFAFVLVAIYCYIKKRKMPRDYAYAPALRFFGLDK